MCCESSVWQSRVMSGPSPEMQSRRPQSGERDRIGEVRTLVRPKGWGLVGGPSPTLKFRCVGREGRLAQRITEAGAR